MVLSGHIPKGGVGKKVKNHFILFPSWTFVLYFIFPFGIAFSLIFHFGILRFISFLVFKFCFHTHLHCGILYSHSSSIMKFYIHVQPWNLHSLLSSIVEFCIFSFQLRFSFTLVIVLQNSFTYFFLSASYRVYILYESKAVTICLCIRSTEKALKT